MARNPVLPKRLLNRDIPLQKLLGLMDYPLTVVCAPAGYGKTTLAAAALKRLQAKQIWIELESGPVSKGNLFAEILTSFRNLSVDLSHRPLQAHANRKMAVTAGSLSGLVQEMETHECHLIAVFDNSNNDLAESTWKDLAAFLEIMPPNIHAVLLCREKPKINLSRWRLSGRLLEIGTTDLTLGESEAGSFLEKVSEAKFSGASIAALHRLSEGWIVGLQLIALRLQENPDPEKALAEMDWNHPYLFEYMLEEILNSLPVTDREFLLKTSILKRFNSELCDEVTGRNDSAAVLARLLEKNIFVSKDELGGLSRYHRLFSEGLQGILRQWMPEQVQSLHGRAAIWHLAHRNIDAALEHAVSSEDSEVLESIAEKALEKLLCNSDFVALDRHTLRIPESLSTDHPCLAIFLAWGFFHLGREAEGKLHLERAQRILRAFPAKPNTENSQRNLLAHVFYLRGIIARLDGNINLGLQMAYRAYTLVPGDAHFLRTSVKIQIGISSFLVDRLPESVAALKDAMTLAESTDHYLGFFGAAYTLSEIYRLEGCFERQAELHQVLLRFEGNAGSLAGPASGYACIARARILLDQGKVAEARLASEAGITWGNKGGNIRILNYGFAAMAMVLAAEGEIDLALANIAEAEIVARKNRLHWGADLDDLTALKIRLQFDCGRTLDAGGWMARQKNRVMNPSLNVWDSARTLLRLLIAQSRYQESINLMLPWEGFAQRLNLPLMTAEINLLRAIAEWNLNYHDSAGSRLAHTLKDLERMEAVGLLHGLAPFLKPVALETKVPAQFASMFSEASPAGKLTPLSEREVEVLRALRDGKSNKEIGYLLFVAPNTVKTHLKKIFTKLQVNNRTRAIMRAEEFGLIH